MLCFNPAEATAFHKRLRRYNNESLAQVEVENKKRAQQKRQKRRAEQPEPDPELEPCKAMESASFFIVYDPAEPEAFPFKTQMAVEAMDNRVLVLKLSFEWLHYPVDEGVMRAPGGKRMAATGRHLVAAFKPMLADICTILGGDKAVAMLIVDPVVFVAEHDVGQLENAHWDGCRDLAATLYGDLQQMGMRAAIVRSPASFSDLETRCPRLEAAVSNDQTIAVESLLPGRVPSHVVNASNVRVYRADDGGVTARLPHPSKVQTTEERCASTLLSRAFVLGAGPDPNQQNLLPAPVMQLRADVRRAVAGELVRQVCDEEPEVATRFGSLYGRRGAAVVRAMKEAGLPAVVVDAVVQRATNTASKVLLTIRVLELELPFEVLDAAINKKDPVAGALKVRHHASAADGRDSRTVQETHKRLVELRYWGEEEKVTQGNVGRLRRLMANNATCVQGGAFFSLVHVCTGAFGFWAVRCTHIDMYTHLHTFKYPHQQRQARSLRRKTSPSTRSAGTQSRSWPRRGSTSSAAGISSRTLRRGRPRAMAHLSSAARS